MVDDSRGTIIVNTPDGRHCLVTSPNTNGPSLSPSPAPRIHDAEQSAGRRPTQRGWGRGRGRRRSRVCAETTPTQSTQAPRKETQSGDRKPTQARGKKRAGAATENTPAANKIKKSNTSMLVLTR